MTAKNTKNAAKTVKPLNLKEQLIKQTLPAEIKTEIKTEVPVEKTPPLANNNVPSITPEALAAAAAKFAALKDAPLVKSKKADVNKPVDPNNMPSWRRLRQLVIDNPSFRNDADKILRAAAVQLQGVNMLTLCTQYNKYRLEINAEVPDVPKTN